MECAHEWNAVSLTTGVVLVSFLPRQTVSVKEHRLWSEEN